MRSEDKDDFYCTVFTELKKLGVKVPKVKKFKSSISKQEKSLPQSTRKIFGVSLCDQEWTSDSEYLLPKFIASSIAHLRDHITVEGLFRKAGSIARQRDLRIKLENGESLDGSEPNDVASILKQWLRELPEPIIPNYMHDLYIRCQQLDTNESRITAHLLTCLLLPPDHLYTLKYLLSFLAEFATHSHKNRMGSRNVALIMAPNVFVLGPDSADKSSPDLAELHTSVLQLLIENAAKVGEVPMSVSFQPSALEAKSCSELDSSGDVLDFSPCKSRKKRRSGPVQDLFNGIKKLVGQTATTAVNPAPRSASKRKAENNDGSLPKKLTVEVNGERTSSNETPKNKGNRKLLSVDGKTGSGHTRRKSFGLLRRKERKRQKSAQGSPQSKMSLGSKSPFNWNVDVKVDTNILQVPDLPSPVSPFNLFGSNKVVKSDSIKKSTSDCYLIVPSEKVSALSASSSQGQLQSRPVATPYNLRTKFEGGTKSQMQSLESIQLEMKKILDDTKNGSRVVHKQDIGARSPIVYGSPLANSEVFIEDGVLESTQRTVPVDSSSQGPKILQDSKAGAGQRASRKDPSRKSGSRKKGGNASQSHTSGNLSVVGNKDTEIADTHSLLSETLLQLDANLAKKENSRDSHRNGITRQEGFIIKSKHKLKNSLDQLDNLKMINLSKNVQERRSLKKDAKNQQLRYSQSVNLDTKGERIAPGGKVARSRKVSLIRGRPNTVKSGLPTDACQRFSSESMLSLNTTIEVGASLTGNSTEGEAESYLLKNETHFEESAKMPNTDEEKGICHTGEKDTSLNLKFQKFTLSSPPVFNEDNRIPQSNSNLSAEFSIFDDGTFTKQHSKAHLGIPHDVAQKRKFSLPIFEEKLQVSPSSQIPRLRNSLNATRTSPADLKNKTSPAFDSRLSGGNLSSRLPMKYEDSLRDLSTLDLSMNDSCFKTPNRIASPDSITWVSGSKYMGLNLPLEEEAFNKRESIAMILKSKPGHVQAKVSLWDTKVRDSIYCTRSVPTYSTPIIDEDSNLKRRSGSQRERKPTSVSNSCKKRGRQQNIPPPPKFFVSEPNTPSPNGNRPLQEVTNVNFVVNDSKNETTLPDSAESPAPNLRKVKRNSFVSGTPQKFQTEPNTPSPKVGRPLKEVTNVNFVLNGSKSTPSKDDNARQDPSSENQTPNPKKVKRNSFAGNTPQKFQKRVSRSESSPCCHPLGKVPRLRREPRFVASSAVLEGDSVLSNQRLLRSSVSRSGSCLSNEKLRSDEMIDEWQCEM